MLEFNLQNLVVVTSFMKLVQENGMKVLSEGRDASFFLDDSWLTAQSYYSESKFGRNLE